MLVRDKGNCGVGRVVREYFAICGGSKSEIQGSLHLSDGETVAKMGHPSFCATTTTVLRLSAKDDNVDVDGMLVGSGGRLAGFYFFEEPDDAYAEEAEEREPAEDVDEGPVGGLAA